MSVSVGVDDEFVKVAKSALDIVFFGQFQCGEITAGSLQLCKPGNMGRTVAVLFSLEKQSCICRFYLPDEWWKVPVMMEGHVKEEYDWVTTNFNALLASHGYVRDGLTYRAEHANNDTIVFFCHFGLECVLLSHLLHISPMVLWHGTCAAPSSVTTLVTEERRPGIAYFRMSSFGDISHLYVKDEPPAFAARFCECYDNEDERHD